MKKFKIFLLTGILVTLSWEIKSQSLVKNDYNPTKVYAEISTGIDNHIGIIGIGVLIPTSDYFALRCGAGLGTWGTKMSGGFKIGDRSKNGWIYGIGYSYCPGQKDIDLTLDDEYGDQVDYNIDLFPVGSVNITFNRNWVTKGKSIFFIETGYAIPTGGSKFYKNNDGKEFSAAGKQAMQIIRPGGIIFAFGYQLSIK